MVAASKSSLVAIIAMRGMTIISAPVKKLPPSILVSQRVSALTPGSIMVVNVKAKKTADASRMDLPFIGETSPVGLKSLKQRRMG